MSVLGHYFERDGLQTTLISLVREHTEQIRPPRALWVPFDFGRPLGIPGDADFQRRVVLAALGLLEVRQGPVLVDYPEEAPMAGELTGWACPINIKPPASVDDRGALLIALDDELAKLAPWHERALDKHGGSTVGASTISIEEVPAFITAFLKGETPVNPRPEVPLADMLIFACDDLRAYYLEAVSAQPGRAAGAEIVDWFWNETTAAMALWALRSLCRDSADPAMQEVMDRFAPEHIVTRLSEAEAGS